MQAQVANDGEQLPIELDCFLMTWGLFERDRAPGAVRHTRIAHPKKNEHRMLSVGWKPSFDGEEPPF